MYFFFFCDFVFVFVFVLFFGDDDKAKNIFETYTDKNDFVIAVGHSSTTSSNPMVNLYVFE
jgi:hypothetical protein